METILDVEASGAQRNKGHPFDPRNKLCLLGLRYDGVSYPFKVEYDNDPYGGTLQDIQRHLDDSNMLIGVNLKYDLHWCRRYGIKIPPKIRIWDCQLAHFLITAQEQDYPSMDDMARRYNFPVKPDKIKDYWKNGLDTDQIPWDELADYNQNHDLVVTEMIYHEQQKEIEALGLTELMTLCCADLLVLEEMEFNGMKYDIEKSKAKAEELRKEEQQIIASLQQEVDDNRVNFGSGDQLSVILYGGELEFARREESGQLYKSGRSVGQPRYKLVRERRRFDQLVAPIKGTELKKAGFYKTDEPTLLQLKAKGKAKRIIELVLKLSGIQKLIGTYYEGIPKKFDKFQWEDQTIHHNLNQTVVVTGRLSCSNPNLQNVEKHIKECFISRYGQ